MSDRKQKLRVSRRRARGIWGTKCAVLGALLVLVVVSLSACEGNDVPLAKSTTGRDPTVAEIPDKDETVQGADDQAIVTLDLKTSLHERRLTITDDLPGNIIIPTTNLKAVPVTAALQAVLSGTDVSLSWDAGTMSSHLVTVMNLSGPLPKVVDKICSAARVFCDYRHGSLELSEKETFVVALPPISHNISSGGLGSSSGTSGSSSSSSSSSSGITSSSTTNSMVEAIDDLISGAGKDTKGEGKKARVDSDGGNIIYTTTVDGEDRVSQYLADLRTGRPLIVLQMYLWEVTLTRENSQGINWTQLNNDTALKNVNLSSASAFNAAAGAAGSVSLGAVTSGIISANAIASFLATKGRVQTISNPQVTFVSGTSAQLKVGGTTNYISQVGTLTGTTNVSGTNTSNNSNTAASTNTVSTSSIDTGLTIAVTGSYENGIVFANLDLALRNLVSLNPTASGGGTIDLPQTTDEKMNTVLRVRPGDSLVLAGLVTSADTQSSQGLPTGEDSSIPLYGDAQRNNHELVMIVRPSIVLFADESDSQVAKKKESSKPLPDAVVIDKDGSHILALPQPKVQPAAVTATASPEAMTPLAKAASTQPLPITPSDDESAPVDTTLMQRGFSHAFDELLAPAGSTPEEGSAQ